LLVPGRLGNEALLATFFGPAAVGFVEVVFSADATSFAAGGAGVFKSEGTVDGAAAAVAIEWIISLRQICP
jgi:hypothetical protein